MFVTVRVVKNSKVFLPWTMFDASVDRTFAKLFEEVHQLDSSSAYCSTSQAATEKCFLSTIGDCFASRVAVDEFQCCRMLHSEWVVYSL